MMARSESLHRHKASLQAGDKEWQNLQLFPIQGCPKTAKAFLQWREAGNSKTDKRNVNMSESASSDLEEFLEIVFPLLLSCIPKPRDMQLKNNIFHHLKLSQVQEPTCSSEVIPSKHSKFQQTE